MFFRIVNWIRIWILRFRGVKIGKNVKIYKACNIYGQRTKIGNNVKIGAFTEIQNGCLIADNCVISSHSFLCEGTVLEGNNFWGHGSISSNDKNPKPFNQLFDLRGVLLCKGACIGNGVVLCPGVVIGENALIGAGSVVTRSVPSDQVWCGNPARFLKNKNQ